MSATATTLPADSEKPGNVWCDDCQQSLLASRANTHLASKKHADNAASAPEPAKKAPVAREEDDDDDSPDSADEKKATAPKKAGAAAAAPKKAAAAPKKAAARAPAGLPRDPDREGNLWCGICQVSLTAKQSEGHLETKRHQDNSVKHLSAAMKSAKINDL
jgi:hypothetical protein